MDWIKVSSEVNHTSEIAAKPTAATPWIATAQIEAARSHQNKLGGTTK
jgi:hypothetical protein